MRKSIAKTALEEAYRQYRLLFIDQFALEENRVAETCLIALCTACPSLLSVELSMADELRPTMTGTVKSFHDVMIHSIGGTGSHELT